MDLTELLANLKSVVSRPAAAMPEPPAPPEVEIPAPPVSGEPAAAEVRMPAPPETALPAPREIETPLPPEPLSPPPSQGPSPKEDRAAASPQAATAVMTGEQQSARAKTETVRLKIEHLDRLMNLVGELVINKAQLAQIGRQHRISDLSAALSQFDRISMDLQEEVLKTRMVPVEHIFSRYQRMVRDLSKKLNKNIDFQIIGSEIEVDRTLLDEINEPLVHLLRNSIDHGIESPEERKKAGKSDQGSVKIVVKREKNHCSIEVTDDGKGMDADEIRRKAVEKGIISFEESKQLSETETFDLICRPSFSTAKQITDVSGRGVGMDVVKNQVGASNGVLTINSKKGQGSAFVMQLPLTLAVIQSLLVIVSDEKYAIPLTNVSEIARIDPADIKTIEKKEVLLLRDEVIPLIRLEKTFAAEAGGAGQAYYAVIVEVGDKKIGLGVDSLAGQQEIVIKTLTGLLKNAKNFSGATILGDGSVILIVDVDRLSTRGS